jgi:hypothetical protein
MLAKFSDERASTQLAIKHLSLAADRYKLDYRQYSLTPNMYSRPLTTTEAAPDREGGTQLVGLNETFDHVKDCLSRISWLLLAIKGARFGPALSKSSSMVNALG